MSNKPIKYRRQFWDKSIRLGLIGTKLGIGTGWLEGNSHGDRFDDDSELGFSFKTRRNTASICALGRDMWHKAEGRRLVGRRLWLYAGSGKCWSFDIYLYFDKCPYPAHSKYAPRKLELIREAFLSFVDSVKRAPIPWETGVCCCGSPVEGHGMGDGHSPVDEGSYFICNAIKKAEKDIIDYGS